MISKYEAFCGSSPVSSVRTTSRLERKPTSKIQSACACAEQTSSTTGLSESTSRYLWCQRQSRFAIAHLQNYRSMFCFLHGCNAARCTPWGCKATLKSAARDTACDVFWPTSGLRNPNKLQATRSQLELPRRDTTTELTSDQSQEPHSIRGGSLKK